MTITKGGGWTAAKDRKASPPTSKILRKALVDLRKGEELSHPPKEADKRRALQEKREKRVTTWGVKRIVNDVKRMEKTKGGAEACETGAAACSRYQTGRLGATAPEARRRTAENQKERMTTSDTKKRGMKILSEKKPWGESWKKAKEYASSRLDILERATSRNPLPVGGH